jgi:hypothetical protein
VCLKRNLNQEALEHANEAVVRCPWWSKSFCRRAVALQSLGRLEQAEFAMYNATTKLEAEEFQVDEAKAKQIREDYAKIRQSINAARDALPASSGHSHPSLCPTRWNLNPNVDDLGFGDLVFLRGKEGILDTIYSFQTPKDVANFERTCHVAVANAERGRRLAIGSRLLSCLKKSSAACAVEASFHAYFAGVAALRELVLSVRKHVGAAVWRDYFANVEMDPLSLKVILETCNAEPQVLLDHLRSREFHFKVPFDFYAYKFLLRSNGIGQAMKQKLLLYIEHSLMFDDEQSLMFDDSFSRKFFLYAMDDDIMRLAVSTDSDGEDEELAEKTRATAFMILNTCVIPKCKRRSHRMAQDDPIFVHSTAFHALYTLHVPKPWPCQMARQLNPSSRDWWSKEKLEKYWQDEDPIVFQMWKQAIVKLLEWVRNLEEEDRIYDFLLVNKIVLYQGREYSQSPISDTSFVRFLVVRSLECGGAVSLSVRLRNKEDFTELFGNYFEMIDFYTAAFPVLWDHAEQFRAQHQV